MWDAYLWEYQVPKDEGMELEQPYLKRVINTPKNKDRVQEKDGLGL